MVGGRDLTDLILNQKPEDSFYVLDLGILERAYKEWTRVFPTIRPFYAVKCNPDPGIVETLANLGSSFDCASPAEIELVSGMGVEQERIIYANPCKRVQDLNYKNLKTTFDSVSELKKLSLAGWTGGVLMRIRADDPEARCNLGIKYGAEKYEWKKLLGTCADLGLKLVGVSFHVGSMARNASAFQDGILSAIEVIEMAKGFNFDPKLVDIGGGFSSNEIFDLGPVPEKINDTIALFPDITFIAEPGRYFAEHVGTLVTPVIGVKGPGVTISESLYGSFNCILFDHAIPSIAGYIVGDEFKEPSKDDIHRILFGSTCDGGDILSNQILLLKNLKEGDWIVWPRMGAYTSAATTRFNGIPFNERQTFVIRT